MSKIIILSWEYKGAYSTNANSICVNNIIKESLFKKNIIVITGGIESIEKRNIIDDVIVHTIPKINTLIKKELVNYKISAMKIISNIIKDESTCIVFAVSFPFDLLMLGRDIKLKYNNKVKLLIYELDPYSYNQALRFYNVAFPIRYNKEVKVFEVADKIFLTNELYKSYINNKFKKYISKFIDLGIPILNITDDLYSLESNKKCEIVYTGVLSKKFRDPWYMLELFSSIKKSDLWTLHLYGVNKEELNKNQLDSLQDRLFIHKRLPRKKIQEVLKNSSILLNVSNSMNNQLPSKLLDYIGYRKPIINIYSNKEDISKEYLSEYPIKLQIYADVQNLKRDSDNLRDFIFENNMKLCDYNEVKKKYNKFTIESIVKKIDYYFDKCINCID